MHPLRVLRATAQPADLSGRVLCHELRSDDGRVALPKGRVLDDADSLRALDLQWTELHLVALDADDVHEDHAGHEIASGVAGDGTSVRPQSGGHWPIVADSRGVLSIDTDRFERINQLDGPCVYSLYDGQVVEAGEVVARAKIVPFAINRRVLSDVESILRNPPGAVQVRRFGAQRVGAIVHETMGERAITRFRDAVTEKIRWFGSSLGSLEVTPPRVEAIANAFAAAGRGAESEYAPG